MTKRPLLYLVPALLLFLAGFWLGAAYDLAINQAVWSPENAFAIFMEAFGWLPAFMPTLLLALLWARGPGPGKPEPGMRPEPGGRPEPLWRRIVGWVAGVGGFAGCYAYAFSMLVRRGWATASPADWRLWLWLALGLAFFLACFLAVGGLQGQRGQRGQLRQKAEVFFYWATAYLAANQVVVYLVKSIWQRTRFDDMMAAGSLEPFIHWFAPPGAGGSSFPSGHTANAAGILVLVLLCDIFPAWRRRRPLVYALCWLYIATMAWARILIGRHFLSDTLAAAGIMALLLFALRRLPLYRRSLARAGVNADAEGPGPNERA